LEKRKDIINFGVKENHKNQTLSPNTPTYGHRAQAFSDKSYPSVPTASPSPGP
jgi:hypothetical protein